MSKCLECLIKFKVIIDWRIKVQLIFSMKLLKKGLIVSKED